MQNISFLYCVIICTFSLVWNGPLELHASRQHKSAGKNSMNFETVLLLSQQKKSHLKFRFFTSIIILSLEYVWLLFHISCGNHLEFAICFACFDCHLIFASIKNSLTRVLGDWWKAIHFVHWRDAIGALYSAAFLPAIQQQQQSVNDRMDGEKS